MTLKILPKIERAKRRAEIAAKLAEVEDLIEWHDKSRAEEEARRARRPRFLRGLLEFLEMMTPVETVHLGLLFYSRRNELRRQLEEFDRS